MKQWIGVSLVTLFVIGLSACGGPAGTATTEGAGAAPATTEAKDAPAEGSAPAMEPSEPVTPPAAASGDAHVEAAAAPASGGIVGTIWKAGDYTLKFEADGVLRVKGGSVPAILPNGLEGSYSLKDDGSIELNAGGSSFSGSFAGGKLTIDGSEATTLTEF